MTPMGESMPDIPLIPRKANDTPIANASMLVATAKARTTFNWVGSTRVYSYHL